MPMNFPVHMPIFPGMKPPEPPEFRYEADSWRSDTHMVVIVRDHENRGHWQYHKRIRLKCRWYQTTLPAERIRRAVIKAERIAKELNHSEMYLAHEAEIGVRNG